MRSRKLATVARGTFASQQCSSENKEEKEDENMSDHNEEVEEEERPDNLPQVAQQSAAWEWNIHLARVYRKEAARSFQRRVVNQAVVAAAKGKESATVGESNHSDVEADGTSPTSHDDHDEFSYCRQHRNVLPPHRPRNSPEEYRLSALEYDHDVALIPPTDPQDIALALPAALERERIFEQGVVPLLCKRIWNYRGLDYSKAHPMAGFAGTMDTVAPDSWAEDGDKDGKPWPHGTPGLLDELNEDTSKGETEKQRSIRSFAYIFAICFLNIFAGYLTVYYKNSIPVGGVRTNLRDVLFRRMQNLQSPLKDKLTPGAASGLLVDKVTSAVGIYYSFLTFPSLVTGILAHIVVSISSLVKIHYSHLVILPTIFVVILAISSPILINLWYQPEYCLLTRLDHQWTMRLRSIAGSAIPRNGRSYRTTTVHAAEDSCRDEKKSEEQPRIDEETGGACPLPQVFHETAWLQTLRHWQAWKFSAIILFVIQIVSQLGIAIVTIFAAYAVISGQGITVGNFATLISSITSILTLSSTVGSFFTGLYDNHMMLKQISCVMNDDDITFGGGTDHFKIVNKLRLSSAALKLKHPRQHSNSNHHNDKQA